MSPPGRPKGEFRSAQHEGTPVSPKPPEGAVVPIAAKPSGGVAPARIESARLFGGAQEVHILHLGNVYRLKQTAQRKLILTK